MVGALIIIGILVAFVTFGAMREKHVLNRIKARRCTRQWKKFECHHKALDETLEREWQRLNS